MEVAYATMMSAYGASSGQENQSRFDGSSCADATHAHTRATLLQAGQNFRLSLPGCPVRTELRMSAALNSRRGRFATVSTVAPLPPKARSESLLSCEPSRSAPWDGLGTVYDPFSAHRYLDGQGDLSHVTLARGGTRYGLNAEFAFSVLSEGQAWLGLDVERITVNGWYYYDVGGGSPSNPIVQRNGAFVTAKAGFDLSKRWSHGLVGIGKFVGLTYGGVQDARGFGVIFGVRAACGLF